MASERERLRQALGALAQGEAGFMALGRVHAEGEPTGWREDIAWERGGLQSCLRWRSPLDAGGARIGRWQAPAQELHGQALAQALVKLQFWALQSDTALEPGVGIVNWTCATAEAVVDLVLKAGSPRLMAMAPLDQVLRDIANALEAGQQGSSLRLALQAQGQGTSSQLRLGLVNEGSQRTVLVGPAAFGAPGPAQVALNGLQLELAAMPEAVPGQTAPDAVFKPMRLNPHASLRGSAPWEDEYIVLHPRQPRLLPQALVMDPLLDPLPPGRHIVRAVYAYYGALDQVAGMPVVRGRVFSNEVVIQV